MEKIKGWHSEVKIKDKFVIKKFKENLRKNFEKEVYFLNKLKNKKYVPKLLSYNKTTLEVVIEKVEGLTIKEFLNSEVDTNTIKRVLKEILEICYDLDVNGIDKTEMTNPYKHIIVNKESGRITLIDWERAKETNKPKNVTSFITYIFKNKDLLMKKGITLPDFNELLGLLKEYKQTYSRTIFEKIIRKLGL